MAKPLDGVHNGDDVRENVMKYPCGPRYFCSCMSMSDSAAQKLCRKPVYTYTKVDKSFFRVVKLKNGVHTGPKV